jgi:phosphonate transport system substrate-binding protein
MTHYFARRVTIASFIAGALLVAAVPARADWHDQYKELNFGISSSENERDAVARYDKFAAYMTKKLGVPVHILWGTDYAAVIEALHSSKIQFATIGAANYALGRKVMGDKITAVATSEDNFGSTGYHSVIVVKTDSPYQKIDDLKGKVLAWADPNSTSGYAVPLYFMKKDGIDPSSFFSKTPFSGSHELGVVGVVNGTFDAAADDWTPTSCAPTCRRTCRTPTAPPSSPSRRKIQRISRLRPTAPRRTSCRSRTLTTTTSSPSPRRTMPTAASTDGPIRAQAFRPAPSFLSA